MGSAGDEFAYLWYFYATLRKCKQTLFLDYRDISQFALFKLSIDNCILSAIFLRKAILFLIYFFVWEFLNVLCLLMYSSSVCFHLRYLYLGMFTSWPPTWQPKICYRVCKSLKLIIFYKLTAILENIFPNRNYYSTALLTIKS